MAGKTIPPTSCFTGSYRRKSAGDSFLLWKKIVTIMPPGTRSGINSFVTFPERNRL
jgi:hypothetical protein